ncbi:MAG: hypothetical protein WCA48_14195 [Pseudomonas gingeri]
MDYPKSVPSVGLVNGKFVDENPVNGTPGSLIPAAWGNSITDEVVNVVKAAGLVPDEADLGQLLLSIQKISQSDSAKYALDTGASGTYVASYAPALKALVDGVVLCFKAQNGNTGASTFSPNGLTAAPIVGAAHSALQGGEIVANGDVWVQWNSSIGTGSWVLIDSTGGAFQVANASKSQHAVALGQLAGAIGTTAPQFDSSLKLVTTAFLARSGKQLSGVVPFTGALTGGASHVGGFLYGWSATANSYSLPNTVSLAIPVGAVITLANFGTNAMAIVPQGTDKTQTPSLPATSLFTLVSGASAEFTHIGSGIWFITGNAVNSSSADFAASLTPAGYQRLPSGLIIQWGSISVGVSSTVTIAYPIAFPTQFLGAYVSNGFATYTASSTPFVGITPTSTPLSTAVVQNGYSSSANTVYWFAFGK